MPSKQDILDLHFMDSRCKLLDLAAFIDRVERHPGAADFRFDVFKEALAILSSDRPQRAKAMLEAFSDHSTEPLESAPTQGACGAPTPN